MKTKTLILSAVACIGMAVPAFADGGGPMGVAGVTTAMLVDVPEGIVVNSAAKCPIRASQGLAEAFGDAKGWKQQIVGAVIGIPTGAVWGVPYGFMSGARNAMSKGWDKPFSSDSFVVVNEEK